MARWGKGEIESGKVRIREEDLRESRDATWTRKPGEAKVGSLEIGTGECGADGAPGSHAKGEANRGGEAGEGAEGSDKGSSRTKDDVKKREGAWRILEGFSYEGLALFEVMYGSVRAAKAGRAAAEAKAGSL